MGVPNRSVFYEKEGTSFYIAKSGELKDMGGDWKDYLMRKNSMLTR